MTNANMPTPRRARSALLLVACCMPAACYPALKLAPNDADVVLADHRLDAPDPATPGALTVRSLYYGSGTDRNRAVYRDSVTLKTEPVDASKLVDLGESAKSRNRYWGFTPSKMPLNARVWYPDGPGPFPIVLVVHGNHDMKDFSDPGYEYLGRLLASRGYILASLDMNFINGGIRGENDARGWFFLKHLEQWRKWNGEAGNVFEGKVDLGRVALIGHSRGGEAVGHAAAFNRLSHYPDDGNVTFDFGFGIQSIIAIAPVDGQYQPQDRLVPVEDVNYLVFHGAHDGDVSSFMGIRQYQRVQFTGDEPRFKAAVFVYRANHGQWNSVWGPNDNGPRSARILDLRTLMEPEDQRRFAEVYISAFLDATLKKDARYLPLFRDHRVAAGWLPKTMYITRFEESTFRPVASFEEDIDLSTGSADGVGIEADSLATWKENRLVLRTANSPAEGSSQYNHAVTVGWNNRIAGDDTTRMGRPASFAVTLPARLPSEWRVSERSSLQFLLMPTDAEPGPRRPKPDSTAADSTDKAKPKPKPAPKPDPDAPKPPIDLTVEVTDAAGVSARVPLSDYGAIRRPLETYILRRRDVEKQRYAKLSELVLQTYAIPLADFRRAAPAFDPASIRTVRFLFDRSPAGTVVIDDIGFSAMDPAYYRVADENGGAARPNR